MNDSQRKKMPKCESKRNFSWFVGLDVCVSDQASDVDCSEWKLSSVKAGHRGGGEAAGGRRTPVGVGWGGGGL